MESAESGAGGGAGVALEPSCSGLADGPYCGNELSVPGELTTSYQCSGGVIIAAAECAGSCKYGAGATDTSSSGGSPDESSGPCGDCVAANCQKQSEQCAQTGSCGGLQRCKETHCVESCGEMSTE